MATACDQLLFIQFPNPLKKLLPLALLLAPAMTAPIVRGTAIDNTNNRKANNPPVTIVNIEAITNNTIETIFPFVELKNSGTLTL